MTLLKQLLEFVNDINAHNPGTYKKTRFHVVILCGGAVDLSEIVELTKEDDPKKVKVDSIVWAGYTLMQDPDRIQPKKTRRYSLKFILRIVQQRNGKKWSEVLSESCTVFLPGRGWRSWTCESHVRSKGF